MSAVIAANQQLKRLLLFLVQVGALHRLESCDGFRTANWEIASSIGALC